MEYRTKAPNTPAPATPDTPAPAPVVHVTIQQPDRAAEGARAMAEGRELNMDTADVAGGRYLMPGPDGKPVETNANGHPVGSSLDVSR